MARLAPGETVMLIDRRDKRYVTRLVAGATYHFHGGQVPHDALIGAEEGVEVISSKGYKLVAYRQRLLDYIMQMPRHSAIIYPKDLATILFWADIYPGATVFESGLGSGALTLALLPAPAALSLLILVRRRCD